MLTAVSAGYWLCCCGVCVDDRELSLAYTNTPMPNTAGTTEQVSKDFDITQYGEDLTEKARNGKLQPVIGRDDEIDHIAQVRRRARPPACSCMQHGRLFADTKLSLSRLSSRGFHAGCIHARCMHRACSTRSNQRRLTAWCELAFKG